MKITNQTTDLGILAEIGERLGRTRLTRNLTQAELAEESGVSKRTVERAEKGESVQLTNLIRILRALDLADRIDVLVPEPGLSPLAQLEARGKQRQRASGHRGDDAGRSGDESTETWTWGE